MDILKLVVDVTTFILSIEFLATVWFGWKLIKSLPRVSALPIVMTCLISGVIFIYTWLTFFGPVKVVIPLNWVIFTRSMIMLLMGCPVWVMMAVLNVPCKECTLLDKGVQ